MKSILTSRLAVLLFLIGAAGFCCMPLCGQNVPADTLASVTKTSGFSRVWHHAVAMWERFSATDSVYISPNIYECEVMMAHITNLERHVLLYGHGREAAAATLTTQPHHSLGAYVGWRCFLLGWSVGLDRLYHGKRNGNGGTEFDMSFFTPRLSLDLFYRHTDKHYTPHSQSAWTVPTLPPSWKISRQRLHVFYTFNARRLSYPAAYSQSALQLRPAGGASVGLSFDRSRLRYAPRAEAYASMLALPDFSLRDLSLTLYGGYGYNLPLSPVWLLSASASAGLSLHKGWLQLAEAEKMQVEKIKPFSPSLLARFGLLYNNKRFYAGVMGLYHSVMAQTADLHLHSHNLNVQVYTGINFHVLKQYR